MPVWSDKLVQEVIRLLLEAYYEPQFSNHSHGFCPQRGCHTALREIYHQWTGVAWFIEGDISQCLEEQPSKLYTGRSELERRLLAEICERCGATDELEVHHIRAMKDLHTHAGREKPSWMVRMIALKRKTMILCRTCHEDITYGRPMRRQMIELAEVKARQKAQTMILESRVH